MPGEQLLVQRHLVTPILLVVVVWEWVLLVQLQAVVLVQPLVDAV